MKIQLLLKLQNDDSDLTIDEINELSQYSTFRRLLSLNKTRVLLDVIKRGFTINEKGKFKSHISQNTDDEHFLYQVLLKLLKSKQYSIFEYVILQKQIESSEIAHILRDEDIKKLIIDSKDDAFISLCEKMQLNDKNIVMQGYSIYGVSAIKRYAIEGSTDKLRYLLDPIYEQLTLKYHLRNVLDALTDLHIINLNQFLTEFSVDSGNKFYEYCKVNAENKHLSVIKLMMDKGVSSDEYFLYYAIKHNIINCVENIIASKKFTDYVTLQKAIDLAAVSGNIQAVNILNKFREPNIFPSVEAFLEAAQNGHYLIIEWLISQKSKGISDEVYRKIENAILDDKKYSAYLTKAIEDGYFQIFTKIDALPEWYSDTEDLISCAVKNRKSDMLFKLLKEKPSAVDVAVSAAVFYHDTKLINEIAKRYDINYNIVPIQESVSSYQHEISDDILAIIFPPHQYYYSSQAIFRNIFKSGNIKLFSWIIKQQYPLNLNADDLYIIISRPEMLKIILTHPQVTQNNFAIMKDLLKSAMAHGHYAAIDIILNSVNKCDIPQEILVELQAIPLKSRDWGLNDEIYLIQNNNRSKNPGYREVNKAYWSKLFSTEQLEKCDEILNYSPYGFKLDLYHKILLLLETALAMETQERAQKSAYRLTVLFNTEEQVLTYLKNYLEQHPTAEFPIHDACHFNLPDGGLWDIEAWRDLVMQYGNQVIRYLHFAPEIATKLNGDEIPIERLQHNIEKELGTIKKEKLDNIETSNLEKYSHFVEKQLDEIAKSKHYQKKPMTAEERDNIKAKLLTKRKQETEQFMQAMVHQEIKRQINKKLNHIVLDKMISQNPAIAQRADKHTIASKEIKRRDLCQKTPKQIQALAVEIGYGKAGQALPEFALMCIYYGYSLEQFEHMIDIYNKGKEVNDILPELFIDGDSIGEPGYYFVKLSKRDPRGLILGELTNCCQSYGNHAEVCAIHGATSPDASFYAIMKKGDDGKIDMFQDKIITQSYAWLSKNGNLVFDSGESLQPQEFARWIMFYDTAAEKAMGYEYTLPPAKESNIGPQKKVIQQVNIGLGGRTPRDLNLPIAEKPEEPLSTPLYQDAASQYIMKSAPQLKESHISRPGM